VVHGYAGTGKTSAVLATLADLYPSAKLVAPTGKAADVLSRKTGRHASTIHRLIYHPPDRRGDRLLWTPKLVPGSLKGRIVLVDEASMISEGLADDMRRTGATLIVFGDPGQLPPVCGAPAFAEPDIMLKEVHRQTLDSPILRQAHRVRRGLPWRDDGDEFRIVRRRNFSDQELRDADIVIAFSRDYRATYNSRLRRLHGFTERQLQAGEPITAGRNIPSLGIFNGAIYELARPAYLNSRAVSLWVDGAVVDVPACANFEFDLGYAITGHRSQGSEWPSVVILDERWMPGHVARRWRYTAITRAAQRVTVLRT
jgi:exodeoxyribonuclease-5